MNAQTLIRTALLLCAVSVAGRVFAEDAVQPQRRSLGLFKRSATPTASTAKPGKTQAGVKQVQYQQSRQTQTQRPQDTSAAIPWLGSGAPPAQRPEPQTRKHQRKEQRQQRPGFFRRLFGRFQEAPAAEVNAEVEPGEAVPAPPPLRYPQNGSGNHTTRDSTKAVGFQREQAPPGVPGVNATANNVHPAHRSTEFINPFVEDAAPAEDFELDLDALLEPVKPPVAKSSRPATAEVSPRAVPDGPYTGVRVEPGEDIGRKKSPTQSISSVTPQPVPAVDAPVQPMKPTPSEHKRGEDVAGTDASDDLREPVMQLPTVGPVPETESDTVPQRSTAKVATPVPASRAEKLLQAPRSDDVSHDEESLRSKQETLFAPTERPESIKPASVLADEADQNRLPTVDSVSREGSLKVLDSRAKRDQQRYRILSRTGKTGFKGFCPVALRDQRELIDSRPEFKATFGLQTYYFSSPEAKAAFEANPSRYAPAAGGSDVVLLVNSAEEVPGSLDFSLWYRDRLYMFRSRETQRLFAADPARYADEY